MIISSGNNNKDLYLSGLGVGQMIKVNEEKVSIKDLSSIRNTNNDSTPSLAELSSGLTSVMDKKYYCPIIK
ncbi:hypothetical protein ACYZFP_03000 [Clostridioides difficile]|nr:hypothetical protein [Clostridioides difficile]